MATLGIDLGLSGARAAVVDAAGAILAEARGPLNQPVDATHHDPAAWMAAVTVAVRAALAAAPPGTTVAAIGLGALGPCPVLLDARLQPLAPAPLFGREDAAAPLRRQLADVDGRIPSADHPLPKLLWGLQQQPRLAAQASLVCDAAGFLAAGLTGRAVMDPTTAADYAWAPHRLPVPLAPVLPADAIAGPLQPAPAAALGLPPGLPVTVGGYDTSIDLAALDLVADGATGGLSLANTLVLGCALSRAPPALGQHGMATMAWREDAQMVGGWTSAAGATVDWAARLVGPEAARAGAALPAASAGVPLMLPYLAGERAPIWDAAARGVMLGLDLACDGARLYRAALDAVALSALDLAERLAALVPGAVTGWRAIGGGARHTALVQSLADALGQPIAVLAGSGQAIGPARLAWRALGQPLPFVAAATVTPRADAGHRLRQRLALYRQTYQATATLTQALAELGAGASTRTAPEPKVAPVRPAAGTGHGPTLVHAPALVQAPGPAPVPQPPAEAHP